MSITGSLWKNSTWEVDDGASSAYTALPTTGKLLKATPPDYALQDVELSAALDDTVQPVVPGIMKGGTLTLEIEYSSTEHARLLLLKGATHNFKCTPQGSTVTFAWEGYVKTVKMNDQERDAQAKITVEVTITSDITVGATS